MVKLYDAIKASYGNKDTLGRRGQYVKDKSLSNDNEQVYYNKKKEQTSLFSSWNTQLERCCN